ncbi:NIPSNAP family protein [Tenacibaculum sp. E3R01]|uniref:NIPSNAP family protein n=1 Tax=Tenacibaculum sp. E3R01 TaxID=2267227 RepID=UPI000DEAAAAF|nr:NIPSNAP family protein [Tenacibaculum sp. E3R01]RBW55777.1 NIPSNAP family protein [Tenacibaculum sp. E3R01]
MITCYLKYTIDPFKVKEFEKYAKMWIPLVEKFEGIHHGYFLPHESANNIAVALFSFKSLSMYEKYRIDSETDTACKKAYEFAYKTKCIISYERNFLKPILDETSTKTN